MNVRFEWDPKKAASNKAKHGITFEEAITSFDDPEILDIDDAVHSFSEIRRIRIGYSDFGILVVVYTEREKQLYRIISARLASRKERRLYYETQRKNRL